MPERPRKISRSAIRLQYGRMILSLHPSHFPSYGRKRTAHPFRPRTGRPAPLHSRRLPVPQPRRGDHLRRQGQEPQKARIVLLHGVARPRPEDPGDGPPDSRAAAHRRPHGTGCATARKLAHQDSPAALQHDAQGRQDLPVDRGAQRAFPPRNVHPKTARNISVPTLR